MKAGELLGEHKKMKDKVKRLEKEVKHLEKHKNHHSVVSLNTKIVHFVLFGAMILLYTLRHSTLGGFENGVFTLKTYQNSTTRKYCSVAFI